MDETIQHKNWFSRNWKWAVPTGGCLLIIIAAVVFAGSLFMGISSIFKESTPYKEAITLLKENQEAKEALGSPIEVSGMTKGGINITNNEGNANFDIPVEGSKNSGILHVVAQKTSGEWRYQILEVSIQDPEQIIKLLPENETTDF